jgi:molybdopterin synthase catalytic subunit
MLEITAEAIDLAALVTAVRTDACGAVVVFAGVVRETSPDDQRPVRRIRYEAYPALALGQMREIVAATQAAFGPLEIAIVHRTGELALGETSIAIAVAAPHRGPAFDGCEYAIDEIKTRLAVWKQEVFADGETAWRANTPLAGDEAVSSPRDEAVSSPRDEAVSSPRDEAVSST